MCWQNVHFARSFEKLDCSTIFRPNEAKQDDDDDLQLSLITFCETYDLDVFRCAEVLFNFARSFEKLDCSTFFQPNEAKQDDDDDLQPSLITFCQTYNLDVFRCAVELFNFARSFEKLDCSTIFQPNEAQQDNDDVSEEDDDLISMMMTRMMT